MVDRPWKVHGPFELDKRADVTWKQLFRAEVQKHPGLDHAAGVYIIAVTNRDRDRIRYVGMTHNQGFETEVFSQRNVRDVWDVISAQRCRTLRIWLLAKPNVSRTGYSFDARLERQSHLLEQLAIMHARAAGHDLINTKKMKSAEGIAVSGLFGVRARGARSNAAVTLASVLGFS